MNYWIYDLLNVYVEHGIEDHIEPRGSIPKYHKPVNTNGAENGQKIRNGYSLYCVRPQKEVCG